MRQGPPPRLPLTPVISTVFSQLALLVSLALFHLVGPVPPELGVRNGTLAPCPSAAHCARANWAVTDPAGALAALRPLLAAMPRSEVIEDSEGYLHATFSSALFGFVDDLELFADAPHGLLQARSVSRLGDSDLGVNGQRLARLRAALPDPQASANSLG